MVAKFIGRRNRSTNVILRTRAASAGIAQTLERSIGMTYEHSAKSTARAVTQLPKRMSIKADFLRLSLSCCVLGTLSLSTQAAALQSVRPNYNSGSDNAPDVRFGHAWITNQAIEYLKRIDPFAYVFAKKYREQL